jgi:predicted TIM-barrel fold metal-dependent hydrolase
MLIDTHIHLFPDKLFRAIWSWFDQKAWPIINKLNSEEVLTFLKDRGVKNAVGLCYAHHPGLAEDLNAYMSALAQTHPLLIPFGTVLPGEPDAGKIADRAFEVHRLRGIKVHGHVQRKAPDSDEMIPVCESVRAHDGVLLIHAGNAPVLPSEEKHIGEICCAARTRRMLERYPDMKTIVPHLGMNEYEEFKQLLSDFDNLYLDTTMAVAGFFGNEPPVESLEEISHRLLFGTDFPNIPYPYDRELDAIKNSALSAEAKQHILYKNAQKLFDLA